MAVALSARSSGSVEASPMSEASSCSSARCSVGTGSSRGVTSPAAQRAAAVPAAWPIVAQVAMTRVEPKATWLAEMLRPANSRFSVFTE